MNQRLAELEIYSPVTDLLTLTLMLTLKDKKHLNFIIPQAYGMTCPWNKNVTMDHARDISCPDDTKLSLYKQGKFIIIET